MLDETLNFLTEEAGELVTCIQDFLVQALRVRVFKGQMSAHHGVEHDTGAPQVCLGTEVFEAFDQLGRRVAWRPTGCC